MPSQLSRLYRFFRHETEESDVIWNVASVPFNSETRLYRVMYTDKINTELSFDIEQNVILNNKWRKNIEPIVRCILQVFEKNIFHSEFCEACKSLLQEDPWLEEYIRDTCELFIKNLPYPCT
jgi:hypothetical protein